MIISRNITEFVKKDLLNKIVMIWGPRQTGKTFLSKMLTDDFEYLNYDAKKDRAIFKDESWDRGKKLVIFDEVHKAKKWKSKIKGIYDTEGITPQLLVTGSAKLDVNRRGGDSLAGRYYPYRLYPFTVKEICGSTRPLKISPQDALGRILYIGGFPEPFLKNDVTESLRWRKSHLDMIIRGDLLDFGIVKEIRTIEILIELLADRVGSSISYSSLAEDLQVSVPTVKSWLKILENLHVIFPVVPYSKNISRSILKEPKYYFYDNGIVENGDGAKLENAVALALWSELHFIEDTLGHKTSLHYLKNKEKKEIDFLVLINRKPKFLIEVKWADDEFSPNFKLFSKYFSQIPCLQLVHQLSRKKQMQNMSMEICSQWLAQMNLH